MNKVVIAGGGAAGMAAAIGAAQAGCQVVVYEKNEKLGKKIYITGKGTLQCDQQLRYRGPVFPYGVQWKIFIQRHLRLFQF